MSATVNSYIGALLITIIGSGAALLIIHIATTNVAFGSSSEAAYASL